VVPALCFTILALSTAVNEQATRADQNADAWAALAKVGHTIIMRHSLDEPGTGDPPGYRFGDCSTQRQLIPEGRAKAARVAQEFAKRYIRIGEVLSSEWCRVRDTAQIVWCATNRKGAANA
jgi:hypothetical protein